MPGNPLPENIFQGTVALHRTLVTSNCRNETMPGGNLLQISWEPPETLLGTSSELVDIS